MMHGVDMKSCILINSIIREDIYIYTVNTHVLSFVMLLILIKI